jgi:uncharacterized protein (DUF305 family)
VISTSGAEPAEVPQEHRSSSRPSLVQLVVFVVVACLFAGVVGWIIGRPGSEDYSSVDRGFLRDMTLHHQGAITLGFDYLPIESDSTMGSFAREIVQYQSQEVGTMNGLLNDAGGAEGDGLTAMDWMGASVPANEMPGMPTAEQVEELNAARGLDADDQFSRLMIAHHAAGAAMAEHAAEHGENDKVRAVARAMADAQRREINEMNGRRVQLGLPEIEPDFTIHGAAA